MTARRIALKSGGFADSVRRLPQFYNHPYPSLERRGLSPWHIKQLIHTLIDGTHSAPSSRNQCLNSLDDCTKHDRSDVFMVGQQLIEIRAPNLQEMQVLDGSGGHDSWLVVEQGP